MEFSHTNNLITEKTFNIYEWFKDIFMPQFRTDAVVSALSIVSSRLGSPYFICDYEHKIAETLGMKAESKNVDLRYPLVALILNDNGTQRAMYPNAGMFFNVDVNIWLIHESSALWNTQERLDDNYKAILYPLYFAFFRTLAKMNRYIEQPVGNEFSHNAIDQFYCEINGNRINDYADAVQINNLNLKFYKNFCKT